MSFLRKLASKLAAIAKPVSRVQAKFNPPFDLRDFDRVPILLAVVRPTSPPNPSIPTTVV